MAAHVIGMDKDKQFSNRSDHTFKMRSELFSFYIKMFRALPVFRLSPPVVIMKAVTVAGLPSNVRAADHRGVLPVRFCECVFKRCLRFMSEGGVCIVRQARLDVAKE